MKLGARIVQTGTKTTKSGRVPLTVKPSTRSTGRARDSWPCARRIGVPGHRHSRLAIWRGYSSFEVFCWGGCARARRSRRTERCLEGATQWPRDVRSCVPMRQLARRRHRPIGATSQRRGAWRGRCRNEGSHSAKLSGCKWSRATGVLPTCSRAMRWSKPGLVGHG